MFFQSKKYPGFFVDIMQQNDPVPAGQHTPSLKIIVTLLIMLITLSGYSTLLIVDKSLQSPAPTTPHIQLPHESDMPSGHELWNCLGSYTTSPEGHPICIQIQREIKIDASGEKFITSSTF